MRKRERTTMLINEAEVLEATHASLQVVMMMTTMMMMMVVMMMMMVVMVMMLKVMMTIKMCVGLIMQRWRRPHCGEGSTCSTINILKIKTQQRRVLRCIFNMAAYNFKMLSGTEPRQGLADEV